MDWVVKENNAAVIALHNCGKSFSKNFELLKTIENFANVHLLNVMRNSGGLKTGLKQDA
jgi:hypothetical protein